MYRLDGAESRFNTRCLFLAIPALSTNSLVVACDEVNELLDTGQQSGLEVRIGPHASQDPRPCAGDIGLRLVRPAQRRNDAVLPGLPSGDDGPPLEAEPFGPHRLPYVDIRVAEDPHIWRVAAHCPCLLNQPGLLGARHEVVDQNPEAPTRFRPEVGDDRSQIIDAVKHLDHDALDPQVVAPDPLDELCVVLAFDEDARSAGDPRSGARDRPRSAGGPRRRGPRLLGGRAGCCRGWGQDDRGAVQEKPGPQREALTAPVAVLQVDDLHTSGLLNSDNRPTPAGLDIFDDEPQFGLYLAAASIPGHAPVTGKDVGAVSVVHGGIVDLALDKAECQRAVGDTGMHRMHQTRPIDGTGGGRMPDERRLAVLDAIVQDYVKTSEPVGSKALLERHRLGVSAATVRNDMAALEDEGLISAPHTSAGRIPTDAGYRMFVDRLSELKPMTGPERTAISTFLRGAVDLDDVVDRTVRLLASLTHQVAVMQYPSLTRSAVRHVELLPMGASRLMVVLILNTGRVEQRVIESSRDRKSTRLNSSHRPLSRMPSSA